MNLSAQRSLGALTLIFASACVAGCNERASSKPAQPAKHTPEESFKFIAESFRRQIEEQNMSFVVTDGNSRTTMSGSNKVSSDLFAPKSADDHYKGTITVESSSYYSLRHTKSEEEIEREQKAKKNQSSATSLVDAADKKDGVEVIDPKFATSTQGSAESPTSLKANLPKEETVQRRPDGIVRKYELVHDGDRWNLVTALDPKTEQSIKFAFDEALARQ